MTTRDLESALRDVADMCTGESWFEKRILVRIDAALAAASGEHLEPTLMTEEQVKHMVDRFLSWRLPKNFNPDNGISYKRPNYDPSIDATPSGTNLFDAGQATEMVRYMIEGLSAASGEATLNIQAQAECPPSISDNFSANEIRWLDLVEKDDRTSPVEYPDHALITREELFAALDTARAEGIAAERERIEVSVMAILAAYSDLRITSTIREDVIAAIRGAKP